MSSPHRPCARNTLCVNGLGALGRISSASDQALSVADQASSASVEASFASVQVSSGTDKASGQPPGTLSVTDRVSFVASELLRHPSWSQFVSDQASSASVQARRAVAGVPIHAPERLSPCPQVSSRPPPVTGATPERSHHSGGKRHTANHSEQRKEDAAREEAAHSRS